MTLVRAFGLEHQIADGWDRWTFDGDAYRRAGGQIQVKIGRRWWPVPCAITERRRAPQFPDPGRPPELRGP